MTEVVPEVSSTSASAVYGRAALVQGLDRQVAERLAAAEESHRADELQEREAAQASAAAGAADAARASHRRVISRLQLTTAWESLLAARSPPGTAGRPRPLRSQ